MCRCVNLVSRNFTNFCRVPNWRKLNMPKRICAKCKKPVPKDCGVVAEMTANGYDSVKVLYCVDCAKKMIEEIEK